MWGWCDLLAIKEDEVLAVQTTSYTNISARVKNRYEKDYKPRQETGILRFYTDITQVDMSKGEVDCPACGGAGVVI